MAATQQELSAQMLAQLRMLDPSASAEVGTPERKILDTVAQALSDAQVDLTQLSGALDVDSKVGAKLDQFLALFGFGRQVAVRAQGFVNFSRTSASNIDIRIPSGTQVMASGVNALMAGSTNDILTNAIFETSFEATLLAGQTSIAVPVRAVIPGQAGNVAANRVTEWGATAVYGIQDITNLAPITGGVDAEDDDELKVRFKNTVFRNLAGTQDQYIALAVAAAFVTKVNVVGPISRYREYIQVPLVDDLGSYNVNPDDSGPLVEAGSGAAGEYTTALSTIPYSKHTYDTVPTFVSNGKSGTGSTFWREELDWRMNILAADKDRGDTYRFSHSDAILQLGPSVSDPDSTYKPNITFTNVYTGSNDEVTAIRPTDTALFEHSYMSTASRNDFARNISNCVDVFIDGSNDTVASTVIPSPGVSTIHQFVTTPTTSKFLRDNYRRWGEPDVKPSAGHIFMPMFWEPVIGLPNEIIVQTDTNTAIYYLNEHYWLVEDITELHGTVRARNGIEFNVGINGATSSSDTARSGLKLNEFPANTSMEILNYVYDKNIVDLQSNLEAAKQVTTDVLVHRSRIRYFKLDVTVMYTNGANAADTNANIRITLDRFFQSQYFGNSIQLSDLLQVIHSTPGVDNVRWSSDIPNSADLDRVLETNRTGTDRPGPLAYNADFFVKDDELPRLAEEVDATDLAAAAAREFAAVPGLLIRSRAQNTWTRA